MVSVWTQFILAKWLVSHLFKLQTRSDIAILLLYSLFIQQKAQKLLSSSTVHCLFAASASNLERTLASPIWRQLTFAGFNKPIKQTIRCSIQSFLRSVFGALFCNLRLFSNDGVINESRDVIERRSWRAKIAASLLKLKSHCVYVERLFSSTHFTDLGSTGFPAAPTHSASLNKRGCYYLCRCRLGEPAQLSGLVCFI